MMDDAELSSKGRRLAAAVEPFAAQVYFSPECHAGYAGLGFSPSPADRLREYRGDAHTAAWTSAGFDAVEIGLLTELYWGLPLKTYTRSRGWSGGELDDGVRRLEERGLVREGSFTELGLQEREAVELNTDRQCRPVIESLGDDFDDVINVLAPIGKAIRAKRGYPASGPHEMADRFAGRDI